MTAIGEYIKTLKISDFTMASTVDVLASGYNDVAVYQVPVRQRIFVGNGRINLGVDDRGTLKVDLQTSAPANIPGVSRLLYRDANGLKSDFLREDISIDATAGVKVGIGGKTGNEGKITFAPQYDFIVIQYQSESDAVVSKDDSVIYLPVTIQAF